MINLRELRTAIRTMTPRTALYRALKEELTYRGNWKALPRGKPDIENLAGDRRRVE